MAMNFGMFHDFHIRGDMTQAEAFDESFAQVKTAEEMGMDSIWLAEHHFSPERSVLASPMVIASAIAARTNRIRVGLAVQVVPLTNPLRLAEEAATVDHISQGRFDFGIGRSGLAKYYYGYNIPYSESRTRFFEALDVIMKGWHQEKFSYEGEFYSYSDVAVVPKPYTKPHPPTRIAVASADTFSIAGQMGYPIFTSAAAGIPQAKERVEAYREELKGAGHTVSNDVYLRLPAYVAETTEKAQEEPRESTLHFIQYAAQELSRSAASEETAERLRRSAEVPYEDILKQRVMFGTPEYCIERLQEYRDELGISGVVLEVNYGGQIPPDRVANSIRLIVEKIMPEFK
jgi:alkanesulfonate monooxygenase SsuD/methylene tetrahydromethanopterin reductase-like flavin-dependent oxidoreductase (luciferase family)